jgi:hypothetical protein
LVALCVEQAQAAWSTAPARCRLRAVRRSRSRLRHCRSSVRHRSRRS